MPSGFRQIVSHIYILITNSSRVFVFLWFITNSIMIINIIFSLVFLFFSYSFTGKMFNKIYGFLAKRFNKKFQRRYRIFFLTFFALISLITSLIVPCVYLFLKAFIGFFISKNSLIFKIIEFVDEECFCYYEFLSDYFEILCYEYSNQLEFLSLTKEFLDCFVDPFIILLF